MEHTRQVHWKTYVCLFNCLETFASSIDCEGHLKKRHLDAVDDITRDALVKLAVRAFDIREGIPCPLCQEILRSEKKYQRHVRRHQERLALFAFLALDLKDDNDDEVNSYEAGFRETSVASSVEDFGDKGNASAPLPEGRDEQVQDSIFGFRPF